MFPKSEWQSCDSNARESGWRVCGIKAVGLVCYREQHLRWSKIYLTYGLSLKTWLYSLFLKLEVWSGPIFSVHFVLCSPLHAAYSRVEKWFREHQLQAAGAHFVHMWSLPQAHWFSFSFIRGWESVSPYCVVLLFSNRIFTANWKYMRLCAKMLQLCTTLQLCELKPAGLLCPWDSPGKNTGVGCHAFLQGIFLTQASKLHLLCLLHWQPGSLPLAPPGKPWKNMGWVKTTWILHLSLLCTSDYSVDLLCTSLLSTSNSTLGEDSWESLGLQGDPTSPS